MLRIWLLLPLAAAAFLAASDRPVDVPANEPGFYLHHFEYDPPAGSQPKSVAVGGEFNNWSQTQYPMKPDEAGHFVADVKLAEGPHAYRFFVDGAWVNDSSAHSEADLEESNGIRGHNSAVVVGPDGRIAAGALHYVPSSIRYFDPISASEARLVFAARQGDVTAAALYTQTGRTWHRTPMDFEESRAGMDYFGGVAVTQSPNLTYFFELKGGSTTAYYSGGQRYTQVADARTHAWHGQMKPAFDTPEWAQHAVWYQIFPERFRNGDKSNDPPNTTPWTARWAAPQPAAPPASPATPGRGGRGGNNPGNRHYGGDIQGIQAELPYLRSLGVTCIYLNPVFKSPSIHKYDTADYRHIDDNFGVTNDSTDLSGELAEDPSTWKWTASDNLFLDFVAEAHRQGFKVEIDGVFNHAGGQFGPFLDVRQNGEKSKYADWFNISKWDPLTWIGFGDRPGSNMPELKKDPVTGLAPGPRDFVFNITRRWLAPDGDPSRGVDGFRLDYAQNVPRVFWIAYRKLVKSIKPDAYITGEIWTAASTYLQGDTWDATMQYPFANALQSFFIGKSGPPVTPTVFARQLREFNILYPFQVALNQMNLLDSHDTDRWASRFVNADHPPAPAPAGGRGRSYNLSKPDAEEWRRMEQSIAVQMTSVGAPMVYYGDEVGMWGATDPDDRQPMIWKDLGPYDDPEVTFNQDLFESYVRLIAIHRRFPALQTGIARVLAADDRRNLLIYTRDLGDARVYVLVNRSGAEQSVEFDAGSPQTNAALIDWLDPTQASVETGSLQERDGRPRVEPFANVKPKVQLRDGKATVALKPWATMILAPRN